MNPDPTSLDRLHDLVVPPPVPWWPPAPGWDWVIGLILAILLVGLLRAFSRWQRNRYRREALAELARYEAALQDPQRRAAALAAVAALLKRTALSAWPRAQVAPLNGAAWVSFLARTGGAASFDTEAGALLEAVAYDPRKATAIDTSKLRELMDTARQWLRHHRIEAEKGGPERC